MEVGVPDSTDLELFFLLKDGSFSGILASIISIPLEPRMDEVAGPSGSFARDPLRRTSAYFLMEIWAIPSTSTSMGS